jgi:plastocyanin
MTPATSWVCSVAHSGLRFIICPAHWLCCGPAIRSCRADVAVGVFLEVLAAICALVNIYWFCREIPAISHSHEEELRLREFLPSAYAAEPVPATGQITGIVRFTGTVPPPRRVETNDGTTIEIEIADLRVGPQTKGLAEVLVFVENPPLTKSPPPRQAAVIDQVNWLFRPRVVGVVAGQEVRFENNDTCNHSVQTQSSNPTNQINASAGPGVPIIHRFEAQRDPIPVSCALHPWMRAYLFVSPHPFFAVTDERGEFALPKLPPGEYRLRWLHPISRLQTHREVTVAAQTTVRLNIVWDRLSDSQ